VSEVSPFSSPISIIRALFLILAISIVGAVCAQTPTESPTATPDPTATPSNSPVTVTQTTETLAPASNPAAASEALRNRITRARALIAAHQLDPAVSDLESVRATAQDNSLKNIASIMLMNVYLEEGNYARASALLEENFQARGSQKDESLGNYFALAGQAVNGARTHIARYRTFGISVTDPTLPVEVLNDLNRLRSFLERMVAQAKEISDAKRAYDSLSLLEDVLGLRVSLAKDAEDVTKWEAEYANAREVLASSQTQIASLGGVPPLRPGRTATSAPSTPSPYSTKKPVDNPLDVKPVDKDHASTGSTPAASAQQTNAPVPSANAGGSASTPATNEGEPQQIDVGSLNGRATKRVLPRYPTLAKQSGASGLVRVHVVIDEAGKVISIVRSEGPMLLRGAAEDAARQWTFSATAVDGKPSRLTGYIDFNFNL